MDVVSSASYYLSVGGSRNYVTNVEVHQGTVLFFYELGPFFLILPQDPEEEQIARGVKRDYSFQFPVHPNLNAVSFSMYCKHQIGWFLSEEEAAVTEFCYLKDQFHVDESLWYLKAGFPYSSYLEFSCPSYGNC